MCKRLITCVHWYAPSFSPARCSPSRVDQHAVHRLSGRNVIRDTRARYKGGTVSLYYALHVDARRDTSVYLVLD